MQRKEVERIVMRAYPKIVQDLGIGKRGVPPVEVHKDIYARLSGDPEAMGEDSETSEAEYDWDNHKIFIYYPNMKNEEDVLRSLLHEHTHTLQDRRKEAKYREMGYENNPHEIESRKAEKNWKKYKNRKHIQEYNEFLNEQLKQSNIDMLKRLFSAYQSNRNSKTTVEKLYKLQHKKPYSEIFKEQKILPPPYYRGMSLDKVPEVGDTFKFGLGGWTTDELVAESFSRGSKEHRIVFETADKQHVFLDMNNFGEAIQQYIKKEYPEVDWDERDISKKPPELSKLYTYSKGSHSGENEVIFEPFTAKVKRVTEKKSIPSIYYVEV